MNLVYELSMPRNNAWDNKWSGDGRSYAIVRTISNSQKAMTKAQSRADKGAFYYDFGDGWCAKVSVRIVEPKEARKIRAKSLGFCGYDWMVRSIETYGDIYADHQIPKAVTA